MMYCSDNHSIANYFTNKRMDNCTMDLYWYCQRGELLLEHLNNLQFSDGENSLVMYHDVVYTIRVNVL